MGGGAALVIGSCRSVSPVSSKLTRDFPEVLRNNEGKGAFVASRGGMCERDNPREFGDRHLCQRPWVQGSQRFPRRDPAPWPVHCLPAPEPPGPTSRTRIPDPASATRKLWLAVPRLDPNKDKGWRDRAWSESAVWSWSPEGVYCLILVTLSSAGACGCSRRLPKKGGVLRGIKNDSNET